MRYPMKERSRIASELAQKERDFVQRLARKFERRGHPVLNHKDLEGEIWAVLAEMLSREWLPDDPRRFFRRSARNRLLDLIRVSNSQMRAGETVEWAAGGAGDVADPKNLAMERLLFEESLRELERVLGERDFRVMLEYYSPSDGCIELARERHDRAKADVGSGKRERGVPIRVDKTILARFFGMTQEEMRLCLVNIEAALKNRIAAKGCPKQ